MNTMEVLTFLLVFFAALSYVDKRNNKKKYGVINMNYKDNMTTENNKYLIRLTNLEDAGDLTKVYSDKNALPFFNSDNCHGDNFYYYSEEIMAMVLEAWKKEYENGGFVRFAIVDKAVGEVIGTIELFNRKAEDYFDECGLLRVDLRSDYEREACLTDILLLIEKPAYEWFECNMIATKAPIYAIERIKALQNVGFVKSSENLIGHDGTVYRDYWCIFKK